MASDNREDCMSRRHAVECMGWVGTAVLWMVSGGVPQSLSPLGRAQAAVAIAQTKPTIPVIVKDKTSVYWQTVLAGARKAGQDFGVEIAELGAQSESDADGQIALLENAVSSNPAAVVIAPAHSAALSKPIDEAAKRVKVVAIDSTADSRAFGFGDRQRAGGPYRRRCSRREDPEDIRRHRRRRGAHHPLARSRCARSARQRF